MDLPASVANKRLTAGLNPLNATLTKNRGEGGVTVNQTSDEGCLSRATIESEGPLLPFGKKAPLDELPCFHAIAHSFPQRQPCRSFLSRNSRLFKLPELG